MVTYKQVILLRKDLKLSLGKACSQTAHASLEAALESNKNKLRKWREQGSKKVVLKVKDEKELLSFYKKARKSRLKSIVIRDAGRTVLKPGTITVLAIGPDKEKRIDKLTGKLKMV